jgi:hypothetical protein
VHLDSLAASVCSGDDNGVVRVALREEVDRRRGGGSDVEQVMVGDNISLVGSVLHSDRDLVGTPLAPRMTPSFCSGRKNEELLLAVAGVLALPIPVPDCSSMHSTSCSESPQSLMGCASTSAPA